MGLAGCLDCISPSLGGKVAPSKSPFSHTLSPHCPKAYSTSGACVHHRLGLGWGGDKAVPREHGRTGHSRMHLPRHPAPREQAPGPRSFYAACTYLLQYTFYAPGTLSTPRATEPKSYDASSTPSTDGTHLQSFLHASCSETDPRRLAGAIKQSCPQLSLFWRNREPTTRVDKPWNRPR